MSIAIEASCPACGKTYIPINNGDGTCACGYICEVDRALGHDANWRDWIYEAEWMARQASRAETADERKKLIQQVILYAQKALEGV